MDFETNIYIYICKITLKICRDLLFYSWLSD